MKIKKYSFDDEVYDKAIKAGIAKNKSPSWRDFTAILGAARLKATSWETVE